MIAWIRQHNLFIILAVATLFSYIWVSQSKKRLRISEWQAVIIAILHTLIGVACVKAFAFLEGAGFGAMSLFGAVFFLPIVYYAAARLTKRNAADVFDTFTICTIFTLMCSRINCLIEGCCMGTPIPGMDTARWPTREMEIVFYIILLILLGNKVGKARYSGKVYPLYMISYGIFRFLVEWLRESDNLVFGVIHISHFWSLVAVAIGAIVFYRLEYKGFTPPKKGSEKQRRKSK